MDCKAMAEETASRPKPTDPKDQNQGDRKKPRRGIESEESEVRQNLRAKNRYWIASWRLSKSERIPLLDRLN